MHLHLQPQKDARAAARFDGERAAGGLEAPGDQRRTMRTGTRTRTRTRTRTPRTTLTVLAVTMALLLVGVMQAVAAGPAGPTVDGTFVRVGSPDQLTIARAHGPHQIVPLSLNGADDRERVSPPYDEVVEVLSIVDGGEVVDSCSGVIVGDGAVLTAAHCIDMDAIDAGTQLVAIFFGEEGVEPVGMAYAATSFYTPDAWDSNPSAENDYALLGFNDEQIGGGTGWATLRAASDAALGGSSFPNAVGYPVEKGEGTQWRTAAEAFTSVGATTLTAPFDTTDGQDGSPVFLADALGVAGIVVDTSSDQAGILRITRGIIDELNGACAEFGCELSWVDDAGGSGEPSDEPTPTPTDPGNGGDEPVVAPPGDDAPFNNTWARTDKPVADTVVSRTWMWGPQANTPALLEEYTQSPDGQRRVMYYDKSRMEITNPSGDASSIWYVTNGLLVVELMTGQMQTGDSDFESREPANINVAGDQGDPNGPTYATFAGLRDAPARADGGAITERVSRDGTITDDPSLAGMGVTSAYRVSVPGIEHQVASPFWAFMNSTGTVWQDGGFTEDGLFENPFYATGYPIAEAYWATVEVAGTPRDVLMQCFERRCLTYTPGNGPGWEVEAGNVGQHYYLWRYGDN